MSDKTNYREEAADDAKRMVTEFIDEILLAIINDGEASTDLYNDYSNGDSYHHETHIDKEYDLMEAAQLLDDLNEFEETDSGLWQSLEPRQAIGAHAAYTYGNAVYDFWRRIVTQINEDVDGFVFDYDDNDGVTVSEACKSRLKGLVEETIKRWD